MACHKCFSLLALSARFRWSGSRWPAVQMPTSWNELAPVGTLSRERSQQRRGIVEHFRVHQPISVRELYRPPRYFFFFTGLETRARDRERGTHTHQHKSWLTTAVELTTVFGLFLVSRLLATERQREAGNFESLSGCVCVCVCLSARET